MPPDEWTQVFDNQLKTEGWSARELLDALPNEAVAAATWAVDANTGLTHPFGGTATRGQSLILDYTYMKWRPYLRLTPAGKCRLHRVGLALVVRAEVTVLDARANLSTPVTLGLSAEHRQVAGHLTVRALGLAGPHASAALPDARCTLTPEGLSSALVGMAVLRSKLAALYGSSDPQEPGDPLLVRPWLIAAEGGERDTSPRSLPPTGRGRWATEPLPGGEAVALRDLSSTTAELGSYTADSKGKITFTTAFVAGEGMTRNVDYEFLRYVPGTTADRYHYGVGIRVRTRLWKVKGSVDTGSLFGLQVAAGAGRTRGDMEVQVIGLGSSAVTANLLSPSLVTEESIAGVLKSVGVIKAQVLDAVEPPGDLVCQPYVVALIVKEADPVTPTLGATGEATVGDLLVAPPP